MLLRRHRQKEAPKQIPAPKKKKTEAKKKAADQDG